MIHSFQITRFSALGRTVPARILQEALVIFVFKQISQFWSFGKCVQTHCAYPNPVPLLLATPLVIHEKNWKCLDVHATGFHVALQELLSSTKFSLNSCGQSGESCNSSRCTSSSSSFLSGFSVFTGSGNGFPVTLRSYFHFFLLLDFPCQSQKPAMKMLKE